MKKSSRNETSPCLFSKSKNIRVVWGITSECNLRCKHCASECEEGSAFYEFEYDTDMLRGMKKSGVDTIYLSGGEPLLYDGVFDIIKHGKECGIRMTVGTNGTKLQENTVKRLIDAGVDQVFVSLDHWVNEKHNFLRGGEVFDLAVKGIKILKRYGIFTRVDSIVWQENYRGLDRFVDFCKELGVDEIAFAWPMKVGRAAKNYWILPPEEEYLKIGKKLEELREKDIIKISYHRFRKFDERCENCPGGEKIFYINSFGNMSPCFWISTLMPGFFTEKNIFDAYFSELLNDRAIIEFKKIKEERYKQFGPGCPAVCMIKNGNFYSKDPLLTKSL